MEHLPGGIQPGTGAYLYLLPLPSRYVLHPEHCALSSTDDEAIGSVTSYATIISFQRRVAERYDVDLRDPTTWTATHELQVGKYEDLAIRDIFQPLRAAGMTAADAMELYYSAPEEEGVIVIFSKKLADRFSLDEAEGADEGLACERATRHPA